MDHLSHLLRRACDRALNSKTKGNDLFRAQRFDRALAHYTGACACLAPFRHWPEAEEIELACRSNAAQCLLSLQRPSEALGHCAQARGLACSSSSPLYPKILLRRTLALEQTSRPAAIRRALSEAAALGMCQGGSAVAKRLRKLASRHNVPLDVGQVPLEDVVLGIIGWLEQGAPPRGAALPAWGEQMLREDPQPGRKGSRAEQRTRRNSEEQWLAVIRVGLASGRFAPSHVNGRDKQGNSLLLALCAIVPRYAVAGLDRRWLPAAHGATSARRWRLPQPAGARQRPHTAHAHV